MKTTFLFIAGIFCCVAAHAQLSQEQRLQDSIIGWYEKYNPADKPVKPLVYGSETFSLKQQQNNNLIVQWMQQTHTPIGSTGKFTKYYFNNKKEHFPHSYGVMFRTYLVDLKQKDKQGRLIPVEETWKPVYINFNTISGAKPVEFLTSATDYYFTLPPEHSAESKQQQQRMATADPRVSSSAAKYLTSTIEDMQTVYLVPGNKLPIIKLSKGEYLDLTEASIDRYLAQKKKDFQQASGGNQRDVDYYYNAELTNVARYRKAIKELKLKHQADKNEPALINNQRPSMQDFDESIDPFDIPALEKSLNGGAYVYKFDPAVYAKCQTDQPQWITITFPYLTKEAGNGHYEMYHAVTQFFNYDYVYNYFFNPEKVKGTAYQPINQDEMKAMFASYRQSGKADIAVRAKTVNLSGNTVFADDFSSNADGAKPAGWYASNTRTQSTVTTPPNSKGKWLKLAYNSPIYTVNLKELPENFAIEYDILSSDFSGMTGGNVVFTLSGKKGVNSSYLSVGIEAGNQAALDEGHNYRGVARIRLNNWPSTMDYNNQGGVADIPINQFTNTRPKVHVRLLKKGSDVTLFLNSDMVATSKEFKSVHGKPCGDCAITPGLKFGKLTFQNMSQNDDVVSAYISNIKVTRE